VAGPALLGRFAPQVGLASPSLASGPLAQGPTLLAPTGFELSPGTLDLWLGPGTPTASCPVARWTYPDGTGGSAWGALAAEATPEIFWARFGYAGGNGPASASLRCRSAFSGQDVLSGPGGDLLLALPDGAESGRTEPGESGPMVWPSGLLAIHGGTAYEFRMADGLKPSDCTTKASAQYRLSAIRSPSGEVMTFTYGCNGGDFLQNLCAGPLGAGGCLHLSDRPGHPGSPTPASLRGRRGHPHFRARSATADIGPRNRPADALAQLEGRKPGGPGPPTRHAWFHAPGTQQDRTAGWRQRTHGKVRGKNNGSHHL
jgi:hypothetical protein